MEGRERQNRRRDEIERLEGKKNVSDGGEDYNKKRGVIMHNAKAVGRSKERRKMTETDDRRKTHQTNAERMTG